METLETRDVPSTVTVERTTHAYEDDSGFGQFRLLRTDTTGELSVEVALTGTAIAYTDYIPPWASGDPRLVVFLDGEAELFVTLSSPDDLLVEPTKTATLTVLPGSGYTVGSDSAASLNFYDNETPVVSVEASGTGEGTATGGFTFTRLGDLMDALTVTYDVGGTATGTTDYTSLSGTVEFAAGADRVEVRVEAIGDNLADDGETVIVTLTGGDEFTYTIDSTADEATVTIADQPLTVSVERIHDGDEYVGGAAKFLFIRSGDITSPLTVSYNVTGTATSGDDFNALSGTVTFDADSAEYELMVDVTDDVTVEQTETVVVTLDTSTSYQLGNASDALFIFDNDRRQVVWTGNSAVDPTDWSDPANWFLDQVPVATDNVVIGSQAGNISNLGYGLASLAGLRFSSGYSGTATLANSLSVGTFQMDSGTLNQPIVNGNPTNLTVTTAFLWKGGTLNNIDDSGAVVDVYGATGVIDPPDTGSMGTKSTLRVVSGAFVTLLPGTLEFLGGLGIFVDAKLKFQLGPNTDLEVKSTETVEDQRIEIAPAGSLKVFAIKRTEPGTFTSDLPILNKGSFTVEGNLKGEIKGRIGGAAGPSIKQEAADDTSFTHTNLSTGSKITAAGGMVVTGGAIFIDYIGNSGRAVLVGDFTFSPTAGFVRTLSYSGNPAAVFVVEGDVNWTKGVFRPRMNGNVPNTLNHHGQTDAWTAVGKFTIGADARLDPDLSNRLDIEEGDYWDILAGSKGIDGAPPAQLNPESWEGFSTRKNNFKPPIQGIRIWY